jgi:hypothetical protein
VPDSIPVEDVASAMGELITGGKVLERHGQRATAEVAHQPLRADGLHPGAGVGHQLREPQGARKTGRRSGAHPEIDAGGSVATRGLRRLPRLRWGYPSLSSRQPPGSGW